MHYSLLLISFLMLGCSSFKYQREEIVTKSSKSSYRLQDMSGKFRVVRQVLYKKKHTKLLTKFSVKNLTSADELEKTFAYSEIKKGKVIPTFSRHSTWLDRKKFTSQIKSLKQKNKFEISLQSPEEKWNGVFYKTVPSSRYICFFSQIANCIQNNGLISRFTKDPELEIDIIVIWDNYPFYAEQYLGLKEEFYSSGNFRIDGLHGDVVRIALEIQGQVIFYTYNEKFEFQNMYWVAQGYSLKRKIVGEN